MPRTQPRIDMSQVNMQSVKEIIFSAFGDDHLNRVDFKLIEAVLLLLANQLRVSERRYWVALDAEYEATGTDIAVTEVNIRAKVPKKTQHRDQPATKKFRERETSEYAEKDQVQIIKPLNKTARISSSEETIKENAVLEKTQKKSYLEEGSSDKYKHTKKPTPEQKPLLKKTTARDEDTTEIVSGEKFREKGKKLRDEQKPSVPKKTTTRGADTTETVASDKPSKKSKSNKFGTKADQDIESSLSILSTTEYSDVRYEKILVVERKPSQKSVGSARDKHEPRKLSIVTQDQFQRLLQSVLEIKDRLDPDNISDSAAEILEGLNRETTYSDSMVVLQLAARLEAIEKQIKRMNSVLMELIKRNEAPGAQAEQFKTNSIEKRTDFTKNLIETMTLDETADRDTGLTSTEKATLQEKHKMESKKGPDSKSRKSNLPVHTAVTIATALVGQTSEVPMAKSEFVTFVQLHNAMDIVYNDFYKRTSNFVGHNAAVSNKAIKHAAMLTQRLKPLENIEERANKVETSITQYTEKVNALDAAFSLIMTTHQDELSSMQYELDVGLDAFSEAMARAKPDDTLMQDTHTAFSKLQDEFAVISAKQKEERTCQNVYSADLESIKEIIIRLQETKSDRDEVEIALKDKIGIRDINGFVSRLEFGGVQGDLQKRMAKTYDQINQQESIWQRAIDALMRDLNRMTDVVQFNAVREDVKDKLNGLKNKIDWFVNFLGTRRDRFETKILHRIDPCLSCSDPPYEKDILHKVPLEQRQPGVGAEAIISNSGGGDRAICYPGEVITHPRDLRSQICPRYCGGPRPKLAMRLLRTPPDTVVTQRDKGMINLAAYEKQIITLTEPCIPCNVHVTQTSEQEKAKTAIIKDDNNRCPCCKQAKLHCCSV